MSDKLDPTKPPPTGIGIYNAEGQRIAQRIEKEATWQKGVWKHFCQDVWLTGQMTGQQGVCYAMVAVFLGCMNKKKYNISEYFYSLEGREQIMALWGMQKSEVGWETQYMGSEGLARKSSNSGVPINMIADRIKLDGFYVIGVTDHKQVARGAQRKKLSGHAFAVMTVNSGKGHIIFDPNWGFGIFPGADALSTFFQALLQIDYSDLDGTTVLSRYTS